MSLLRFDQIGLEFGDQVILRNADLSIERDERICLIGRNGAGKSTTLKLIMGTLEADRGEIIRASDLIVSQLEQTLPEAMDMPVTDVIRSGLTQIENLLADYETDCVNSKRCTQRSTPTTAGTSSNASKPR
jgi:ATP-binding cassette subfamily F protein uup